RRDGSALQPGSVLVVDEGGMVGTRQLARLLHHAEQQSVKVVLVGDPKQLPEIDAGGLFRALATRPRR
ncbi:MAG: AAA family ATPase, partial [Desulfosalsimonas sp.]